jgi:hypothetical protein
MSINGVVALPPATPSAMPPFGVSEIRKRTIALQEVMRGVMKDGTHYGVIPGTPKPSLWKAGAEVLCMTFRLAPMLDSRVVVDDLDSEWPYTVTKRDGSIVHGISIGFFEVEATCTIHGPQGDVLSRCSARCNNREAKYRALSLFEIRNTILKMAEKRAFVSAVLMATGASDIFTQDLEDLPELVDPQLRVSKPVVPAPLTQKREAWLIRAAHEANLPEDAVDRCKTYLRSSDNAVVKAFFDDLSRRKPVFQPFLQRAG